MSERGNEFKLWPGRFLGDDLDGGTFSLAGLPPSTFRASETRSEIHTRLAQIDVLDSIRNRKHRESMVSDRG